MQQIELLFPSAGARFVPLNNGGAELPGARGMMLQQITNEFTRVRAVRTENASDSHGVDFS